MSAHCIILSFQLPCRFGIFQNTMLDKRSPVGSLPGKGLGFLDTPVLFVRGEYSLIVPAEQRALGRLAKSSCS